jgi:glycosyltransferase involved in cell wall biosynthesis
MTEMRVAFVNQAIDRILPPIQNSVGACTYGLGGALADRVDLTVYGRRNAQYGTVAERETHDGMHFRFRDAPRADRALFRYYDRFSPRLRSLNHGMNPPVSSSPALFPIYTRAVAHEIGKAHYDVVHVQHSTQFVRPLKERNPGGAVVLQLHAELYPQNNLRVIERRLLAADLVVSVSDYITELTRRQLPRLADRCHTLSNGVDPDEFTKANDHRTRTGPLTVMFAGSVSPHKGVHLLIDAFASIAAAHPDSRLEIVGPLHTVPPSETYPMGDPALERRIAPLYEGNYAARLRAQIPRDLTDRITITGEVPRDDLLARYSGADVFVFPPIWDEGFGLPPVEAMAAGAPVVASRSGAVADTVVDGETGFLVDKGDVPALAAAMSRLLADQDLRARMGAAGRRRALDLFTWSHAAERAMDLYELARGTAG